MRPLRLLRVPRSRTTLGPVGALCIAIALPACLDGIEGSVRDIATSSADAAHGEAPAADAASPNTPPPETPLAALPVCRPEPVGIEAPTAPELPDDAFERCGLVETVVTATPDALSGSQREVTVLRYGDLIVVDTRRVDGLSRELVRFHGATADRGVQRIERVMTSNFPYSGPLREETTWTFDASGDIAEVVSHDAGGTTSSWRWTREEGRLVAQSFERRKGDSLEASRALVWQWEGDRLRFGSQFDSETGVTEETEWSWDDRGRLSAIERRVDAPLVAARFDGAGARPSLPWHRLAFEWTEGGHLAAREVSVHAPSGPVDGSHAYRRAPMDDFEARIPWRGDYASTWPADARSRFVESLWRARQDGTCRLPPTTETHGWPEGERAYDLGFNDGWATQGQGWRYGYGGYGYGYGEHAWVGPEGLGADVWPGVGDASWVWRSFDNRITYDGHGRMISEHFELTGDFDADGGTPAEVGTLIRERVFDAPPETASGDDSLTLNPLGMRRDVAVFVPASEDAPVITRALEWSGVARLGEVSARDWVRTLTADGVLRLEDRVRTEADGGGADGTSAAETTVDRWVVSLGGLGHGWAPIHEPWDDDAASPLAPMTEFTRHRDARGLVLTAAVQSLDGDPSWREETRFTHDSTGDLVESVQGASTPGSWQTVSRWDKGALVLQGSGTIQPDGTLQLSGGTRYRHDALGRLVETEWFSSQGSVFETHHYACEE